MALRKKTVRAIAQVFVGALAKFGRQQARRAGLRRQQGSSRKWPQGALVGARWQRSVRQQGAHQGTGRHGLTGVVTGAPKNIALRVVQRMQKRLLAGLRQCAAFGQTQGLALPRCPQARRLRHTRQADFVATGQHHRRKGPGQDLAQGKYDDLLMRRVIRAKGVAFK